MTLEYKDEGEREQEEEWWTNEWHNRNFWIRIILTNWSNSSRREVSNKNKEESNKNILFNDTEIWTIEQEQEVKLKKEGEKNM